MEQNKKWYRKTVLKKKMDGRTDIKVEISQKDVYKRRNRMDLKQEYRYGRTEQN